MSHWFFNLDGRIRTAAGGAEGVDSDCIVRRGLEGYDLELVGSAWGVLNPAWIGC